jgi:site-specific DNA-methyltransferase (adenine-specific)
MPQMDEQPDVQIRLGDCREIIATLPDCSIDSIVTDPPYELGFMGKKWDASGIAYDVTLWEQCLRVLKPGGHLLAFGGTRTYHRMTCAIEDAGFEIRDCIVWLYSSGFPKSHNLKNDWDGWGTALKPANEPIVLARKPMQTTVADNVQQHGTGAININGTRIGERWPANVIANENMNEELVKYFFTPKASRTERNAGLTALEWKHTDFGGGGKPGAGFNEVTHGKAPAHAPNNHPTVKPLALMRYLVRLVTPPGGTVLEPFAGSGTTLMAAVMEGCNAIGCEITDEYIEIIERRVRWARDQHTNQQTTLFGDTHG